MVHSMYKTNKHYFMKSKTTTFFEMHQDIRLNACMGAGYSPFVSAQLGGSQADHKTALMAVVWARPGAVRSAPLRSFCRHLTLTLIYHTLRACSADELRQCVRPAFNWYICIHTWPGHIHIDIGWQTFRQVLAAWLELSVSFISRIFFYWPYCEHFISITLASSLRLSRNHAAIWALKMMDLAYAYRRIYQRCAA